MDSIFSEEARHLAETRDTYRRLMEETREWLAELPRLYQREDEIKLRNELMTQAHNRIVRMERSLPRPYFARIDFAEAGSKQGTARYYLGKIGVVDSDENLVTLDWRAPVSTLYYDSNVGEVSYDSPGGVVAGTLELKRQLLVEEGELLSYHDVDTVANDELLQPYLGVNADSRLKNIIATIQSEQNRIIREKLTKNILVQGVAGSGKTTVALHRIAYLVYNNRDSIRPGQYMVIGPNQFFISYISAVLPDLDVDSVPQYTYASLAGEILGEPFTVTDPTKRLSETLAGKGGGEISGYKTSMAYKEALDRFLGWFGSTLPPQGEFQLRGFPVLSEEDLGEGWERARTSAASTLLGQVELCVSYLAGLVEERHILLDNQLSLRFQELYRNPPQGMDLDRLHKDRAWIEGELETGCRKSLRKAFGGVDIKILALYRLFLTEGERFLDPGFPQGEQLLKETLKGLRKKTLDTEDLPALLYLRERLLGPGEWRNFRHAVVDEAQDFGEFDLFALQHVLRDCTFTVVGDLAQSVYRYRGVERWEGVMERSFAGRAELLEMRKCYRTTVEIMEAANLVSNRLGLNPAEPVIRHGPPVVLSKIPRGTAAPRVRALVEEMRQAGYQSVALLCKTEKELNAAVKELWEEGLRPEIFSSNSQEYGGGFCAMTGYLAKGLEFDGVILWSGDEAVYRGEDTQDMHLLYVAMTRAMHRLEIFYQGVPSAPLVPLAAG